jgi:signal transduction histidine kinase
MNGAAGTIRTPLVRAVHMQHTTMEAAQSNTTHSGLSGKVQAVLLLRWVLIIATCYLVLFGRPLTQTSPVAALFVAAYLASNIVLGMIARRVYSQRAFDIGVVLMDTVAVSIGLALTDNASSDFFLLYFVVMFLGALTERLGLVVGAAVLISIVHMTTMARYEGFDHLLTGGYFLRVPFLFVVALFFSHLVENARSREREADDARAHERMRMEFFSSVSHDLKNPLWIIQSLTGSLLNGEAGELQKGQLLLAQRIHATVRRLLALSCNLLDAARLEAGRLSLQRTPTNVADIVDDAVSLARSASDLKGIALEWSAAPSVPTIYVDFVQLERVLSNLLDNAIKYTPAGGAVTVSIEPEPEGVAIAVRDNGPGIPPAELAGLFQMYERRATPTRVEGSGLGLFIAKAITEGHGGHIDAQSQVGLGTTITIHLPNARPLPAAPAVKVAERKRRWRLPLAKPAIAG